MILVAADAGNSLAVVLSLCDRWVSTTASKPSQLETVILWLPRQVAVWQQSFLSDWLGALHMCNRHYE